MIEREAFEALKRRAAAFLYTSLTYLEYETIEAYDVLTAAETLILLAGEKTAAGVRELHWAANEPDAIIGAARDQGADTLVTFVPEVWRQRMIESGFAEAGILREYWIFGLKEAYHPRIACAPIGPEECGEAALVTRRCHMQSREFYGETEESVAAWLNGGNPDAEACGVRHSAVLACREDGRMTGVVLTGVYNYEGKRGPILWVRELAVLPEDQGRGYGRALLESALQYGLGHGAKNAFLMADDCNAGAIALYRKIGFTPNMDEAQIDLIYRP